ncbi:F-box protein At5g52880 isoform X2 [Phalaenopsis equestris]|uniref:F-box protein At5g52880 isoform X2 n=1 Tax=Phalaenopsis equestris TaxID=78828 RepID=UPI0009E5436E|nr:F-box protein At5g52880 isoform X2 [Phalaenopsis equestris]
MAKYMAEGFDEGGKSQAEKYAQLGLADALSRPYDYSSSCQELALILRRAYSKLPKNVQSLIFRDTLSAFRLLPNVEPSIGIPAANLLVQAAEAALPKQKKTLASSEFKHVMVAQRRRLKVLEHEGSIHLPQDILLHVFRSLDVRSLVNASSVCRSWNAAAKENMLWMSQYSIIFGKFNFFVHSKSGDYADNIDAIMIGRDLSANFDWRGVFIRRFIGCSAWRSRPHRAICMHCQSVIWLSGLTCDTPHRCRKSEQGRIKIKPIPAYMLVDYLLDDCESSRHKLAFSFSDSDESDSDGSPAPKWLPKLWAFPRLIG